MANWHQIRAAFGVISWLPKSMQQKYIKQKAGIKIAKKICKI